MITSANYIFTQLHVRTMDGFEEEGLYIPLVSNIDYQSDNLIVMIRDDIINPEDISPGALVRTTRYLNTVNIHVPGRRASTTPPKGGGLKCKR